MYPITILYDIVTSSKRKKRPTEDVQVFISLFQFFFNIAA